MALAKAGFFVDAVCPPRHPLAKISAIRKMYAYDGFTPTRSFADAFAASEPDLVIPGDELAVRVIGKLYDQALRRATAGDRVCSTIEASLGPADTFPVLAARAEVMELAKEQSIRIPKTISVASAADLNRCSEELLFPFVLKADGTSGGNGVRIVRSMEEAKRALRTLQSPPSVLRAIKRVLIDEDASLLMAVLSRQRSHVIAQEFVEGQDATSLVACWKGEILATLHFQVVKKQHSNGPASVMRRIQIPELDVAVSRFVRRLKLSGIHGFDFLIEARTGHAYLIEVNARPTQVGHITLGPGHDIPASLYAAVTGTKLDETQPVTEQDTIALFPQEWIRNPQSVFLRSAYHDIPWEEPELIRAGARSSRRWNSWYAGKKWAAFLLADRVPPTNE